MDSKSHNSILHRGVIAYWGLGINNGMPYQAIGIVGTIFAAVCVVLCIVIGLAFKNGKANVDKIIHLVSK